MANDDYAWLDQALKRCSLETAQVDIPPGAINSAMFAERHGIHPCNAGRKLKTLYDQGAVDRIWGNNGNSGGGQYWYFPKDSAE